MFIKNIIIGSLVAFTLLVSCNEEAELEKGPELENENDPPITQGKTGKPKLDIEDASSLVVLSNITNSGGRIAGESSNLYKITTTGSFEEVMFLNEDNTPIDSGKTQTSIRVDNLFDVNKEYIVLQGQFMAWDTLGNSQYYYALLVNKIDGAIYDFNTMDIVDESIFEDENGNFYYRNNSDMVVQVNISNPDLLKKSEYLPSGQIATSFYADTKGNVIYKTNLDRQFRMRKMNGGIYEINFTEILPGGSPGFPYLKYGRQGAWVGLNGRLYFETYDVGSKGFRAHFHTIGVDEQNTVVIDTVWTGNWANLNAIGNGSSTNMRRVNKKKSILFVDWNKAWEFFEETNTLNEVNLPQVERFDDFFHSDAYLYYRSGVKIYKVSLTDYSHELISLPQDDQYEVYSMNIGNNETLQLSALRFSDGIKIIAQINSDGTFSVVDEELDKEAILLQRLN